ncbi:MAG TPA: SDR family NAD(P)-dependent oxidoreductase, partial [Bacteroidia bacterium]|nr:SDR family NAD(P)-dependent oxidoreductase [Bacteroidia bacterium]
MQCDLFDLRGRSALVTGGSRGLGKAIARGFVECGAKVMICSRKEDELSRARDEIAEGIEGAEVIAHVADLSRREDTDALAAAALEAFGTVDILVN